MYELLKLRLYHSVNERKRQDYNESKYSLSHSKLLLGLSCQRQQLLPRPKSGNSNLLQLLISEGGKSGQVDLVTHKYVGVPAFTNNMRSLQNMLELPSQFGGQ